MYDFETGSANPQDCEVTSLAALAICSRTLKVIPQSEFYSLCRPDDFSKLESEALRITNLKIEDLEKAPLLPDVWNAFAKHVKQYNLNGKTDTFSAPIPAGHNIINFDMVIYERLCRKFGNLRKNRFGREEPNIFNNLYKYDTLQLLNYWTENLKEPGKLNLDYLRNYFGMSEQSKLNAHNALQDVRDTAAILIKLLEFSRKMAPKIQFKNCFQQS